MTLHRGPWRCAEYLNGAEMKIQTTAVLYVGSMAAVIVAIDVLFFKDRFWERLKTNVGIVLVFAAFYFRFLRGS